MPTSTTAEARTEEIGLHQRPMPVPPARGPVSAAVIAALTGEVVAGRAIDGLADLVGAAVATDADLLRSDDLQLALFLLYELHYGGIQGVDDDLEWNPGLLAARGRIEAALEPALRAVVPVPELPEPTPAAVAAALFALTAEDGGPSLAKYIAKRATNDQVREFLVLRSIGTLREADPHTWGVPRLSGRAKAALVEILSDEYGGGRPGRVHSTIFAGAMRAAGLDDRYGAYLPHVPASVLTAANTVSLFGLHRRLRGAVVGHLTTVEMTSSAPNRLYAAGFRRLGYGDDATWYFDEHVEADAVHEQIAGRDLAGGLVAAEPELLPDVLFGAAASLTVDGWAGTDMLAAWSAGRSSLREPLP